MDPHFAAIQATGTRVRAALNDTRGGDQLVTAHLEGLRQHGRPGLIEFGCANGIISASAVALQMFDCASTSEVEARLHRSDVDLAALLSTLRRGDALAGTCVVVDVGRSAPHRVELEFSSMDGPGGRRLFAFATDAAAGEAIETDVRLAGQLREAARAYTTIAHELRAPLSAMVVNLELLRDSLRQPDIPSPSARERQLGYVTVLRQETTRLNRSLHDLLTQAGARVKTPERFDVRTTITELAALIGAQARRQGVDVTTGLPIDAAIVLGHRDRLKEAFLSIVVNALQAMPSGGRLIMHMSTIGGSAHVLFKDTGPGIPPEIAEGMLGQAGTTKVGGSGIGLHVARGLVELNGGELSIPSGTAPGATIRIVLPLALPRS